MKYINKYKKKLKKIYFKLLKITNIYDKEYHFFQLDLKQERDFRIIYEKCKSYTMTSLMNMFSLYKATEYIVKNKIAGDIVECGVWRGGSMMICALALLNLNDTERNLYLYDTYEGTVKPTAKDINIKNKNAMEIWNRVIKNKKKWMYASYSEVKKNLYSTGYPKENINFIKGKVEHTIPEKIPEKISILRLDTDWYESTYHELSHLFPRLISNGILIIDDYGLWKGVKQATDNYINENKIKIFLSRIDSNARLGIKLKE